MDIMFVDDAALVAHSQEQFQSLLDLLSRFCTSFSLTISLKKTNVMGLRAGSGAPVHLL